MSIRHVTSTKIAARARKTPSQLTVLAVASKAYSAFSESIDDDNERQNRAGAHNGAVWSCQPSSVEWKPPSGLS